MKTFFHPSLCILSLLIRCPTESQFYWKEVTQKMLPWWLSGKESACQCRRCSFDPWAGKIPWGRKWQCTLVFLLGNPVERGAWRAIVHGVAQGRT